MAENKWVTGVINLLIGAITPLITGRGAHLVEDFEHARFKIGKH